MRCAKAELPANEVTSLIGALEALTCASDSRSTALARQADDIVKRNGLMWREVLLLGVGGARTVVRRAASAVSCR